MRARQVVPAPWGDRLALLDAATGWSYDVDEMTTRIWEALAEAPTFARLVAVIGEGYDVVPSRLSRDVAVRLERLLENGLIVWR